MGVHTSQLKQLLGLLYSGDLLERIQNFALTLDFDTDDLIELDCEVSGPSLALIDIRIDGGGWQGNYLSDERDVFRPLQYCHMWFSHLEGGQGSNYATRYLVLMACVHIESLVKRIAGEPRFPLGQALHALRAKQRIPAKTLHIAQRFTRMYNDAKHEMSHPMDTHLFSNQDTIIAYFISRKLALELYSLAGIKTPIASALPLLPERAPSAS